MVTRFGFCFSFNTLWRKGYSGGAVDIANSPSLSLSLSDEGISSRGRSCPYGTSGGGGERLYVSLGSPSTMEMQGDFDRLLFFEHARKTAEAAHAVNPQDADVSPSLFLYLVSWCSDEIRSSCSCSFVILVALFEWFSPLNLDFGVCLVYGCRIWPGGEELCLSCLSFRVFLIRRRWFKVLRFSLVRMDPLIWENESFHVDQLMKCGILGVLYIVF